jgi:hypothetical protein
MVSEVETNTGRDGDAATLHALLSASFAGMAERIDPPSSMTRMSVEDVRRKLTEEDLFVIRRGGVPVACLFAVPKGGPSHHRRPDRGPRAQPRRIPAHPADHRARADLHRARHLLGHVERALFLQVLEEMAAHPADRRAAGDLRPGRERGRSWISATAPRQKLAVVFKMESHNHPSYIEPYQGAATGVGGILRDVFTMGARPIAAMNALSFGEKDHPKTRQLVHGVVEGIGGYGNCFGVPTVGGETRFHPAYNGNCLVNAFAAGPGRGRQDLLFRRLRRRHAGGLSRRQDGARRGRRGDHGQRRIRRHDRGKAPHRAGRRPLHRKAPAGGLPGADGRRAP